MRQACTRGTAVKIGWKYVLVWLVATAVIAFCLVSLGGFTAQAGFQALGISVSSEWSVAAAVALVLISAFQAAVLVAALSVFVLVFKRFRRSGMFD